jgi:hypothetical protein
MTEVQAKRQLRQMLNSITPGSVLHLLSEVFAVSARRGRRRSNDTARK